LKKGPNLSALFHPRIDSWPEHFRIQDGRIEGVSQVGRATVAVLELNDPRRVELRQEIPPDELLFPTPD